MIGYRKQVVKQNLKLTFPELSQQEHQKITKSFYKHLCDIFFELIKMMSISEKEMLKRFYIKNPELITELEDKSKSVIFLYGHYATFEYSAAFTLYNIQFKGFGIYKGLKNKVIDKLIRKIRSRFGVEMIEKNDLPRKMMQNRVQGQLAIYGMIADQSPKLQNIKHWTNFLGVETPVFVGAEVMAKRLDLSVCFMRVDKVKRGFYEVELMSITTEPKSLPDYEITDIYFQYLEQQIREHPEYYFWTHKRWKHQRS
jgi:KDO2-lipid IV(A) lauroyltransferase